MIVFIVTRNGVVDEVFDDEAAAHNHRSNLLKKWSISTVIEKRVKSL